MVYSLLYSDTYRKARPSETPSGAQSTLASRQQALNNAGVRIAPRKTLVFKGTNGRPSLYRTDIYIPRGPANVRSLGIRLDLDPLRCDLELRRLYKEYAPELLKPRPRNPLTPYHWQFGKDEANLYNFLDAIVPDLGSCLYRIVSFWVEAFQSLASLLSPLWGAIEPAVSLLVNQLGWLIAVAESSPDGRGLLWTLLSAVIRALSSEVFVSTGASLKEAHAALALGPLPQEVWGRPRFYLRGCLAYLAKAAFLEDSYERWAVSHALGGPLYLISSTLYFYFAIIPDSLVQLTVTIPAVSAIDGLRALCGQEPCMVKVP